MFKHNIPLHSKNALQIEFSFFSLLMLKLLSKLKLNIQDSMRFNNMDPLKIFPSKSLTI